MSASLEWALGVPFGLPVGDCDGDDSDRHDPGDPREAGTSVRGVATAEAGKREGRRRSADQTADVAADGDVVAPGECEDEVRDDHAECAAPEDVVALLLQHEACAEDPEDGSGRTD